LRNIDPLQFIIVPHNLISVLGFPAFKGHGYGANFCREVYKLSSMDLGGYLPECEVRTAVLGLVEYEGSVMIWQSDLRRS
jgi:hypothetical protein